MRSVILFLVLLSILALPPSPLPARGWHYSFWSDNPQRYLEVIKDRSASATTPHPGHIRAGIVSHHFLANRLIVDFFQGLKAGSSPKTILLIGPNHYHQGTQPVSLSSLPWKTPFGPLRADRSLIARIKTRLRLPEDPQAFSGEHSLGILVPFLKLYFPDAELVPVLLRVNVPEPLLERFGEVLAEFVRQPRHVVILSMDFSHNSSAERAEAADRAARRVIASLRDDQTRGLQVDCRAGLRVLLRTLRTMGNLQVDFRDHTNSAILTGHRDQTGLTSYFTIFFRQCPQSPASLKEKKKGSGFHAFYLFPGVTKPDQ